jgi:hypothetical protein
MRSREYPLKALAQLRERQVESAAVQMARAIRAREDAETSRAEAERAHEEHRRAAERVTNAERHALANGELRAADLAAAEAWSIRAGAEQSALDSRARSARTMEGQARVGEQEAQARLQRCQSEANIVHRHRGRHEDAQRGAIEMAEEEASFEAWRPKR